MALHDSGPKDARDPDTGSYIWYMYYWDAHPNPDQSFSFYPFGASLGAGAGAGSSARLISRADIQYYASLRN